MICKESVVPSVDINKEIIRHYKEGYSQKDIQNKFHIPLHRIRSLLLSEGFTTCSYRSITSGTKNIIELLIYEGYSYRMIAQILNISFHVIRELSVNRDLEESNKERFLLDAPKNSSKYNEFIEKYKNGNSFLFLYESLSLGLQDVCPIVKELMKEDNLLAMHEKCLNKRIVSMLKKDYPIYMIAKKLRVSVSVVKKHTKM